jgi:hypothetical protein
MRALVKSIKQIPQRKQCKTKDDAPQIEIMTDAIFQAPMHRRKQLECFADMSKNDD